MTPAIIYCRFSPRPNANECDSCEKQLERCKKYCEDKEYQFIESFSDKEVSGTDSIRNGLSAALDCIRSVKGGVIDAREDGFIVYDGPAQQPVFIVDSLDRLARDILVSLTLRHEIESAGARIEYANGTPIGDTPETKLILNILSVFAAYERDKISFLVSRGMKKRQANGEFFGRPPIGYERDPNCGTKLIINGNERMAVAHIISIRHNVLFTEIAERITQFYGDFRGKPWSARTVRHIISKGMNYWENKWQLMDEKIARK